jgi:hypothetical protein
MDKQQDLESVIEYTANSRGFYPKNYSNQMVTFQKIEVEKTRPWLQNSCRRLGRE